MGDKRQRFFAIILIALVSPTLSQTLTPRSKLASASFPSSQTLSSACYDGLESIYIFGNGPTTEKGLTLGANVAQGQPIYHYNITADSLEVIGQLPLPGYMGTCVSDSNGNLYYVNAVFDDLIWRTYRFSSNSKTVTLVDEHASLNAIQNKAAIVKTGPNMVMIFSYDVALSWDLGANVLTATTPLEHPITFFGVAPIYDQRDNSVYLVGGARSEENYPLRYSISSGETSVVRAHHWPQQGQLMAVTAAGANGDGFIIPGASMGPYLNNRIIRYNLTTLEPSYLSVTDYPFPGVEENNVGVYGTTVVWVEELERIYFFGGSLISSDATDGGTINTVFYVELNPPTPTEGTTTTTPTPEPEANCEGKNDGIYPHPTECDMFIGCRNGETSTFLCESPLLFDPLKLICTAPTTVECGVQCFDKADGEYPHPNDCQRYVICLENVADVRRCPPPLLFDPIKRFCNFGDLVQC